MLSKGLQNYANPQHTFLHMGSTPPLYTMCKKTSDLAEDGFPKSVLYSDSFLNSRTIMAYKRGWMNGPDKCGFGAAGGFVHKTRVSMNTAGGALSMNFLSTFHF